MTYNAILFEFDNLYWRNWRARGPDNEPRIEDLKPWKYFMHPDMQSIHDEELDYLYKACIEMQTKFPECEIVGGVYRNSFLVFNDDDIWALINLLKSKNSR
jgi:hypothetical protein